MRLLQTLKVLEMKSLTHEGQITLSSVMLKVNYLIVNKSPAEGRGARPPVTSGNLVRSGNDCMWDFRSSRMEFTLSNLSRYNSNLSSAWAKRSFCAERKSAIILPTRRRSFSSCWSRSLYPVSSSVASLTWNRNTMEIWLNVLMGAIFFHLSFFPNDNQVVKGVF